ncbi:unnamed protein product [Fraxinus pennsylvanica]|uniref:Uncharacterized protein n=1 Tax=Fraxinus pennsylvanica TaxID=56036 RepID=A0AAD2DJ50_9LAMI|nr:unnamed protein product [Fraxinus pennsylvanica]
MESWRPKYRKSGKTEANAPCKKHPKHRQSPGVCSICLREKLSQLSTNSSSHSKVLSSLSSSYLSSLSSSSNISSYSSPVNGSSFRMASVARGSMSSLKSTGKDVLKKSRSMAFFLQRQKDVDNNGKSKSGFWWKLLHPRNKGLTHSRTVRERVINGDM